MADNRNGANASPKPWIHNTVNDPPKGLSLNKSVHSIQLFTGPLVLIQKKKQKKRLIL